ncbi:DUF6653 family protein [Sediminimonas sp.]|jgi:hypothetical protein|uniref:DUF6653 family protein n=1 Tax=Sediminimonas sp. TaxID=2823379 RepID=UPI0025F34E8D|nr:DUF6653 family protein [Sediminimonas sp.]
MLKILGPGFERMMSMNETVWARHANPWSGWSRVSMLPLLALAVWSRIWIGWWALIPTGAVLVWAWLNPRLFPPPASIDNWMSKGVLGERIWLSRGDGSVPAHHAPILRALTLAVSTGSIMLLAGIVMLDLTLTLTGLAVAMLCKLWILDRMVWIYTEANEGKAPSAPE